jgi:hypothetical protein
MSTDDLKAEETADLKSAAPPAKAKAEKATPKPAAAPACKYVLTYGHVTINGTKYGAASKGHEIPIPISDEDAKPLLAAKTAKLASED